MAGDKIARPAQTSTHWGAYHARVADGRLVAVEPVSDDPDPSPIGNSLPGTIDGECRIRRPAVRLGFFKHGRQAARSGRGREPFVEVSWSQALDLVAGEIERVRREHGNEAIFGGSYGWSSAGRFHHAQSQVHRFLNSVGGYTAHVNTYSYAAAEVISPHIIGDLTYILAQSTTWPVLARHAQLIVSFGGIPLKNAQVNSGGVSRHTTRHWLEQCRSAGVHFVNIGPIRDDVGAFLEPEWLPARPNTDVAIMLALAHTLLTDGTYDRDFLARYCVGFDRFAPYLAGTSDGVPKDAQWAAGICGLAADKISALARRMWRQRTLINISWSIQRGDHGEQPYWMAVVLAAMLGGIGRPGEGFCFGYGASARIGNPSQAFKGPTLPQGKNRVSRFIPVARIADMLLHPRAKFDFNGVQMEYPDIRLVYWAGGNPFHHHQDLNRLVQAWHRPEAVIVHEQFWNAHARHADVVLPATTSLEREDIGSATGDNSLFAMRRCIEPIGEARDDYDIFAKLASSLGVEDHYTEGRTAAQWLEHLYESCRERNRATGVELPSFSTFWSEGVAALPEPTRQMVFLEDFRLDPQRFPLQTPSGRIEIFSQRIASFNYEDCPGHPVWLEPYEWLGAPLARRFPLHLISNQPATKLHSQLDNGAVSLASKISGREPVSMNPQDAAKRGLSTGDIVRVFNDRGACLAGVVVSDTVRQGVVQLATGAWYCPHVPGQIGCLEIHGNPNVLTRDKGTSRLAQGPTAHTTLVEVEPYRAPPPPITVFAPPELLEVAEAALRTHEPADR